VSFFAIVLLSTAPATAINPGVPGVGGINPLTPRKPYPTDATKSMSKTDPGLARVLGGLYYDIVDPVPVPAMLHHTQGNLEGIVFTSWHSRKFNGSSYGAIFADAIAKWNVATGNPAEIAAASAMIPAALARYGNGVIVGPPLVPLPLGPAPNAGTKLAQTGAPQ